MPMPYYYSPSVGGYTNNPYMLGNQVQTQQPQIQQPQTSATNGLNWVQGEAGAKSFLVAPNQTVMLMDSESEVFYIKASDASGMPMPLRVFDYKERNAEQKQTKAEFATKSDYDELAKKYNELVGKYNAILERLDNVGGGADAESVV